MFKVNYFSKLKIVMMCSGYEVIGYVHLLNNSL